ncbi:MAG: Coq4 family protein [Spirulina sp.]
MVSQPAPKARKSCRQTISRFWPLAGIQWTELRAAYRVFLHNPAQGILHILAAGRHSRWQAWVERRLARQAAALAGQTIAVDLDLLIQKPPHTLGGAYARHMRRYGFNPQTFRPGENPGETWLQQRMAISHDLYHVVTGFDASPVGEFGVAAYTVVQYRDLLNGFVLSFVPLSLSNPQWTLPLLRALGRGFAMGLRGKPVIAYPLEYRWDVPLSMVREELGLGAFFHQDSPPLSPRRFPLP